MTSVHACAPQARAASAAAALGRGSGVVGRRQARLDGCRDHARAQRFGEHQAVAGAGRRVRQHAVGVDRAGDAEPVLRLDVLDGVAAEQDRARLGKLLAAAAQDGAGLLEIEVLGRDGQEVERRARPRAHGVQIAQRVGRRDLAELPGIVHDRRQHVHRLHQRQVVRQPVHTAVVTGPEPDEHVGVGRCRQPAHQPEQVARTCLRRSPRGAGAGGQALAFLLAHRKGSWDLGQHAPCAG